MNCSTPGLPVHHQLPEFTQTHIHQVSDAIQPSHPLLSPSPPAPNPSQYQSLFQWVNSFHEVPKYWSFSFSIIPSKEIPRLISFRMDRLDILATQGTFKNLLQHHSSKASILRRSAFFTVQLSHPYMTTPKTITLTRWTFVGKVMSLLLNMLSRLVITFLPRSKHLLISWLQSPSEWSGVFPYFLLFKSEFGNKGFMIQATVSSQSWFCWLYRASPSLAAKNIISLISVLTSGDVHIESLLLCCWKRVFAMTSAFSWQNSILAFTLLHSVLQGQIYLLLVSWLPTFAFQSPII